MDVKIDSLQEDDEVNIFEEQEDYYQFLNTLDLMAYFVTLSRYIHQNPVKAGMVSEVKDYEFSSWGEYMDKNSTLFPLCDTHTVLNRIP